MAAKLEAAIGRSIQANQGYRTTTSQGLADDVSKRYASNFTLLARLELTLLLENLAVDLRRLREAYLPETLLAYIITLQFAGQHLSREFLLECMEFATMVADEDFDLLGVFVSTGHIQELVEALAFSSKNLVLVTSQKPGSSRSKKYRMKGWTHDLWSVKKDNPIDLGLSMAEH